MSENNDKNTRKDKYGIILTCLPIYSNCQLCKYKEEPIDSEVCKHCIKYNKSTEYYKIN